MTRALLGASLVLVSLVLGVAAPAHAYRTGADLPELRSTERVAWAPGRIGYRVHEAGGPGLAAASVVDTASLAFSAWSEPACAALDVFHAGTSSRPPRPEDGQNDLYWVRETGNWAALGLPADAVGVTDLLYERDGSGEWRIAEADILLNGVDYRWARDAGDPGAPVRSLRAVLTHEAGHFLGLLHACGLGHDPGAPDCGGMSDAEQHVMYPAYVGPSHYALSSDDAAGACFLYDCRTRGCPRGLACADGACVATCGEATCGLGEACDRGTCRARCTDGACDGRCTSDPDCEPAHLCLAGTCVPDGAPDGDPCASGAECRSRTCSAEGRCVATCGEDLPCPARHDCVRHLVAGECVPRAGVLGDACAVPGDCTTGLCLRSTSGASACTRACSAARACPAGHDCARVDGRDVCVPRSTGGCAAAPAAPAGGFVVPILAIAFIMSLRRPRRST